MTTLYPPIEPFSSGHHEVSDLHTLYWEQCGNPEGRPVVFLHGGPGGGLSEEYRRFFDPEAWRIILFDQRGSGKSTPHAELRENTTWDLISDIEALRIEFGIEKWAVFGGSWGSTLSLIYAISHPERVTALILRGIFLCRPEEIRWFYQEGASWIFPDEWERFVEPIPPEERNDLPEAYYRRLTSDDAEERLRAAKAWSGWEGATSKLVPDSELVRRFEHPDHALAMARIECHYFRNGIFLESPEWILENIERIREIPAVIVQGRYDVVCPMRSAWDLHRVWPEAELRVVTAGHSALDDPITAALVEATDSFRG